MTEVVVTPAIDLAVGFQAAGVIAAATDLHKRPSLVKQQTATILSPAIHPTIQPEAAGIATTPHNLKKWAGVGSRLTVVVLTPAVRTPVRSQPTRMPRASSYLGKGPGLVNRLSAVENAGDSSPAVNAAVVSQTTGVGVTRRKRLGGPDKGNRLVCGFVVLPPPPVFTPAIDTAVGPAATRVDVRGRDLCKRAGLVLRLSVLITAPAIDTSVKL